MKTKNKKILEMFLEVPPKERVDVLNTLIQEGTAYSEEADTGSISDKYHTFDDLYYQRYILFIALMKANPDKSWKSRKHYDGTMFEGSFICGMETEEGNYTYHLPEEMWDKVNVQELDTAPKWDGHTSEDVTRLLSLGVEIDFDRNKGFATIEVGEDLRIDYWDYNKVEFYIGERKHVLVKDKKFPNWTYLKTEEMEDRWPVPLPKPCLNVDINSLLSKVALLEFLIDNSFITCNWRAFDRVVGKKATRKLYKRKVTGEVKRLSRISYNISGVTKEDCSEKED